MKTPMRAELLYTKKDLAQRKEHRELHPEREGTRSSQEEVI
jgi:hypothetical protein